MNTDVFAYDKAISLTQKYSEEIQKNSKMCLVLTFAVSREREAKGRMSVRVENLISATTWSNSSYFAWRYLWMYCFQKAYRKVPGNFYFWENRKSKKHWRNVIYGSGKSVQRRPENKLLPEPLKYSNQAETLHKPSLIIAQ